MAVPARLPRLAFLALVIAGAALSVYLALRPDHDDLSPLLVWFAILGVYAVWVRHEAKRRPPRRRGGDAVDHASSGLDDSDTSDGSSWSGSDSSGDSFSASSSDTSSSSSSDSSSSSSSDSSSPSE